MRSLKEILELKIAKEGIVSNLIGDEKILANVLNYIEDKIKDDTVSIDLSEIGLDCIFESSLYIGENTRQYLLDVRLFDNKDDSMINAYLDIFNEDLSNHEEYIDDVWSYDNWEVI